jgi:nicotinamidase-related amidase
MPDFDPRTTALVLIDLQKGIVGMPLVPHSGDAVLAKSRELAERFRAAGAPVVLVHVGFSEDFADAPSQNVDQPTQRRQAMPADWTEFAEGLAKPKDILILKRQWGAFYGTDLDLQLRRRGVTTMVLGGIATNFGVESTARQAWEHGYDLVIAEDACASMSAELHDMAVRHIFPRISRVVKCADIGFAAS